MRKVKVGGIPYQIRFSEDQRTVAPEYSEAMFLHGCASYHEHYIGLHNSKTPGEIEHTFFHELTHLIVDAYHIHNMTDENGEHLEDSIDLFGMGLADAIKSLGINIKDYIK
jgi:hypothetical protein